MFERFYRNRRLGRAMMTPLGMRLDRTLVRLTGQSLVARIWAAQSGFKPLPVLLLVTKGRKTGHLRRAVLPYFSIGDTIYVVGSNGGKPRDAFRVENLRKAPEARLKIGMKTKSMTASILAEGSKDRDRIWTEAKRLAPVYADYQARTSRTIPVVALRQLQT